jgi:integrase/recombinase XerD
MSKNPKAPIYAAASILSQSRRGLDALQLSDLDADAVMRFLDYIEIERSNLPITRNCRRAAIRGFFKHLGLRARKGK